MKSLFQAVFILSSVSFQVFGQRCKLTRRSEYGLVLVGHWYKSFTADRLASCYSACNTRPDCQSLNYNLADKTCQFNNETHRSHPEKLKSNDVSVYAENPDRGKYILFSDRSRNSAIRELVALSFNPCRCDKLLPYKQGF